MELIISTKYTLIWYIVLCPPSIESINRILNSLNQEFASIKQILLFLSFKIGNYVEESIVDCAPNRNAFIFNIWMEHPLGNERLACKTQNINKFWNYPESERWPCNRNNSRKTRRKKTWIAEIQIYIRWKWNSFQ